MLWHKIYVDLLTRLTVLLLGLIMVNQIYTGLITSALYKKLPEEDMGNSLDLYIYNYLDMLECLLEDL